MGISFFKKHNPLSPLLHIIRILLVYSLDKSGSLDTAESLYRQLNSRGFHFVPKFLVANKSDILQSERRLTVEDGIQKAEKLNIPLIETSALGHDSVVCMVRDVIRKCDVDAKTTNTGCRGVDGLLSPSNQETTTTTSWFARLKCKLQGRVSEKTNN